jgi:diguanylate cyclase (GGDEF)-like protein/PAS domain S-box-containing protein
VVAYARRRWEQFLCLGQPGQSSAIAGQVRAAQIEAVRRYTPWMMVANVANAIVLTLAFLDSPKLDGLLFWAGWVTGLAAYALWGWWRRRRRPRPRTASLRGIRRTVIHTGVLGAAWALLPALFYSGATVEQQLVLAVVTAGMMCGSGFALATIPPAALTFGGMLTVGSIVALWSTPGFETVVVMILNLIYIAVIFYSSIGLATMLRNRFESQIISDEQRDFIGLLLNDFEEHGSDWLWVVDRDGRITHVSSRLQEILGKTDEDLIGRHAFDVMPLRVAATPSRDDGGATRRLLRLLAGRQPFRDLEVPVEVAGALRIWALTGKPVFLDDGAFDGYRGVGRDVTVAAQARREIDYLARFDPLTGLANRTELNTELADALDRLNRRGEAFALLLLDLDHFKLINDTQGHGTGDDLLKQVAARLLDVIDEDGVIARVSADEFGIVLFSISDPDDAVAYADRISRALDQPFGLPGGDVQIGASIGIVCAPGEAADVATLLRHADLALQSVKSEGRGRYAAFVPDMDATARRRHRLETDLRQTLESGGFSLAYQALVDARSEDIVAFEALVRWRHPELGPISPAEFIPIAEEMGLIVTLGGWVLREACRQAVLWPASIRVAVNLSALQFRSPSLFHEVRTALDSSGLRPERLELEVTESLLLDENGAVHATLEAFRSLRVRIALDDFGTGYSALSYLREYHFDKLKIDRSFVENIETERESGAVVRAIVAMARELGIRVCVEGVETPGQFAAVRDIGCDEIQGYLISKPLPAEGCAALLDRRGVPMAVSA